MNVNSTLQTYYSILYNFNIYIYIIKYNVYNLYQLAQIAAIIKLPNNTLSFFGGRGEGAPMFNRFWYDNTKRLEFT